MKGSKHMLTIVVVLALISFMSLSFSASYSYVMRSKINGNTVNIVTGNLNPTAISAVNITNANIAFLSDEDGMNQSSYSTITINKPTSYNTFYYVNFFYSSAADETHFPMEDMRAAIYLVENNVLSAEPLAGPFTIGDLPNFTNSPTNYKSLYVAYYGILDSNHTSVKLAVKFWADKNSEAKYDERAFTVNARIYQYPLSVKGNYTLSGTVYDSSSNPVEGANIVVQNGIATATTDSSGAFTLTDFYNGTWNFDVFYNGNRYATIVRAEQSSNGTVSVSEIASSTLAAGNYLQSITYSKYTTPYKIINDPRNSGLTTNSNELTDVLVYIPRSYRLYGNNTFEVSNIDNVNITLEDDFTLTMARGT